MDLSKAGMSPRHGACNYDTVQTHQQNLLRAYASMADEFHFRVVDARRPVDRIKDELRRQVSAFLEPSEKPAETIAARCDTTQNAQRPQSLFSKDSLRYEKRCATQPKALTPPKNRRHQPKRS